MQAFLDLFANLGVDWYLLAVHFVLFGVLFLIMSKLLWGPLQKRLHDREEEIEAAKREIAVRREEAERLGGEYAARMKEIEDQAYQKVQAAIARGIDEKNKLIAEAQARAEKQLTEAREQIRREKQVALEALRSEIAAMSADLVQKITEGALTVDSAECEKLVETMVAERLAGEDA